MKFFSINIFQVKNLALSIQKIYEIAEKEKDREPTEMKKRNKRHVYSAFSLNY